MGNTNPRERRENRLLRQSGEYGKCADCGAVFRYTFLPSQNRVLPHPLCPKCRAARLHGVQEYTIPYTPHAAQQKVHASKARFRIMVCGNRFGKDLCAIAEGIRQFLELENEDRPKTMSPPVHWWIIAPSIKLARQNWRDLKSLFPRDHIESLTETDMMIQSKRGGVIEVMSAYDEESVVGVGLDIATITEAGRVDHLETLWANVLQRLNSPGRGRNGSGGMALVNSTPNMDKPKTNRFLYHLMQMGDPKSRQYSPSYASFHFTTWDNPYMQERRDRLVNALDANGRPIGEPITGEEEIRKSMTEEKYRQDYLAEFIFDARQVFTNLREVMVSSPYGGAASSKMFFEELARPDPKKRYRMGYDPATKHDGHPVVIFDGEGNMVHADPMEGLPLEAQWDKLAYYSELYYHAPCYFGAAGIGETMAVNFSERGIPAIPVKEHGSNKQRLVENFALLVETGRVRILDVFDIYEQLEGYERQVSESGSSVRYGNGSGTLHDDWVSAMYIALSDFHASAKQPVFLGRFV